jgi:beta-glucosidase
MVLLNNKNNILPLSKNIKSIAVLGPNSNDAEVMYANYNGFPSKYVTPLEGIREKLGGNVSIYHNDISALAGSDPLLTIIPSGNLNTEGKNGLKAEYFKNENLEGKPEVTRIDSTIDFNWESTDVGGKIGRENFSARWVGKLVVKKSGKYNLAFSGDDGFRVWINGELLINLWERHATITVFKTMKLKAGENYDLKIEYFQMRGAAVAKFRWAYLDTKNRFEYLTEAAKCDIIVYVGGLSAQLEGEEMDVPFDGFSGGDRTKLELPVIQTETLKKLKATGKPVILVNMSGSAIALNWEDQNLDAILQAWYPGQEGGTAIADVLFGDYNPAGRLPVTFYKSVDDLPAFTDYNMEGRTYRYFRGEPLYPFGYGLSYTTFSYSNLQVSSTISTSDIVKVTVDVENTGSRDGEEVVQLYVKIADASVPVPIHALQGFKRVALKAGEKKTVGFELKPKQFSVIDDENKRVVQPGNIVVFVGGQQPSENPSNVLGKLVKLTGKPYYIK